MNWRAARELLVERLAPAGFDLVAALTVGAYNEVVPAELAIPSARPAQLVLLVGNTEAMWGPFVAWLRADPTRLDAPHPLERYVVESIGAASRDLAVDVRYAHEPPPRRVAIQRMAERAGLAWLAPSHLSIHPAHGPWISLRAVVVVDADGPDVAPAARTCDACAHACLPALERALALGDPTGRPRLVEEEWHAWLAVRDACPVGRGSRYSSDHVRYGYTKDVSVLRALVGCARDKSKRP